MKKKTEIRPGLDIAVVGMAGRFPRAKNLEEFWNNLKNGVNAVTFFTDEELIDAGVDRELLKDPNYVKANVILEDVDYFDAGFFDYPPVEAEALDPQMRLFHECVWEALEDAGYDPDTYDGLIGLYSGAKSNAYWAALSMLSGKSETLGHFAATQYSNKDSQSTLVSYKLNLRGPSFTLQTACSTSLVAIHLGCQALLNGECDMALAGGSNINMPQNSGYLYQEGMLYSSDGLCRTFDARADGSIFGSGAGAVVLKRIEDAIADRDNIYAVIKGSAINNDGNRKPGFTAPSVDGQKDAIKAAHLIAEVEPESIGYVETHGTATTLGDPVEFEGLKQAFNTTRKSYCGLGSVKTNIGHLDAAAGVAGFLKTVLSIKNRQLPPTLNFERPSPKIDFVDSPFYVNTELQEWKSDEYPLRAGVSTFGVGGTNAHIVLEEAPENEFSTEEREWKLICLSAKTTTALDTMAVNLEDHFTRHLDISLADAAFTLQKGRKAFQHRKVLVCRNTEEAIQLLLNKEEAFTNTFAARANRKNQEVALLFSEGAKAQVNACLDLYNTDPVFSEAMDQCLAAYKQLTGKELKSILYPAESAEEAEKMLQKAEINQPLTLMLFYAVNKLLRHWGINPYAMAGSLAGELAGACVEEIFSLKDAFKLINLKNRLDLTIEELEKGVRGIRFYQPARAMFSGMYADWVNPEETGSASYWIIRLQHQADFSKIEKQLQRESALVILNFTGDQFKGLQQENNQTDVAESYKVDTAVFGEESLKSLLMVAGQLWSYGIAVNWNNFYQNEVRYRIPLPTYPFERKRYWLNDVPGGEDMMFAARAMAGLSSSAPVVKELEDWFYIPSWKRSVLTTAVSHTDLAKYRWLVFVNENALGNLLTARLRDYASNLVIIRPGESFEIMADNTYTVNPANAQDYKRLFEEIKLLKEEPIRILHLWNLYDREETNAAAMFDSAQQAGLYSLLYSIQALNIKNLHDDIGIKVIANSLYEVTGEEKLSPEKSTLHAILKVIPQEYAGLHCAMIDVALPQAGSMQEKNLVRHLLSELAVSRPEIATAYRGGYRWVEDFEPYHLGAEWESGTVLRDNGVYLITGGLGSLGLILAEYLTHTVQAKLVLTTRSVFPAREGWDSWLSENDSTNPISLKINKLKELELLGAEISVVKADAGNEHEMQEVVASTIKQFGQLNGVIHSAGIVDGSTFAALEAISKEDFQLHFQSKVYGLFTLEKVLASVENLDFCMLMSSMASVLGGLGHVAYSAANIFMDAYIHQHNKCSTQRWLCVNWETIRTTKEKDETNAIPQLGVNELFITPQQMLTGFQRILFWANSGQATNRIVFATGHLETRMDYWIRFKTDKEQRTSDTTIYERPELSEDYIAPRSELETQLAEIWQKFFSINKVGIEDNFFELGGDSLKAIMIIEKMHKEVNAKIPIAEFFKKPSVSGVADYFEGAEKTEFVTVERAGTKDYYPLSPAQRSMYMIDELEAGTANNGLFVNEVKGKLDKDRIQQTFRQLIQRHEALRTSFVSVDDVPYQNIHEEVAFEIEYYQSTVSEIDQLIDGFVRPFDLSKAPLLRVGLVEIEDGNSLFMMDMHHLIADPVSEEILLGEFIGLYKGEELPPLTAQYKDFVEWQEKLLDSDKMKEQEVYWLNEFKEPIPVLNLPTDYERPPSLNYEGDEVKFEVSEEELLALKKLAKEEGVTLYMLLLALYNVFLSKVTFQEDIVIGSPIAGRKHADFEGVLGMFLNMLPIRNYPKKDMTFREFMKEVKDKVLQSFEHQDYQFEYLVDKIVKVRDLSRNPLFDTTFTLLQTAHFAQADIADEIKELSFKTYEIPDKSVKFDLVLQAEEFDNLRFAFYFRTKLFSRETIEEFASYFLKTICGVLENPSVQLKNIHLVDDLMVSQTNIFLEESDDFGF